jgi:sortase (surface protein transpeptidase)
MRVVQSTQPESGLASTVRRPRRSRGRHASSQQVVRRPWAVAAAVAGAAVLCGAVAGFAHASHSARPPAPAGHAPLVAIPRGHWAAVPQPALPVVAAPVSLTIPAIGVTSRLTTLGLTKAGALQVPSTTAVAGWYTGSARPGATGAAVIAGHVDSRTGPGVFFRLRLLRRGDLIYIRRADHSLAVFRVTAVHTYLKVRFPTNAVYGAVPYPQLRLITCGGTFDPATGHYLSNVIVYATLVTARHAPRSGKSQA